jgi:threo-3-hydroxy-L-aspartate ammonia-lyase
MIVTIPSMEDVRAAESVIRKHLSPAPLVRSYALENILGLDASRRVWLKDYGWTPVGSFKLLGALNWVHNNLDVIGDRPIVAHSSGNFACGISFAGMRYKKRVLIVMPETAPQVKFEMAKSFGAEIRTYDIAKDHETGERDQITRELAEKERAIQASPYDDRFVIAGNGVGGLEITTDLRNGDRDISHFLCQVSGGGLMAGHALSIFDGFPAAQIIGVEPVGADDFRQSLESGQRTRIERPTGICDGLLSYDVGEHNWPILKERCTSAVTVPDLETRMAMRWLFDNHGLRTEPSGAITVAAVLHDRVNLEGKGDIVLVVSGRNVDPAQFDEWINL